MRRDTERNRRLGYDILVLAVLSAILITGTWSSAGDPPAKAPIPSKADQAKAKALILDIFKEDLVNAKDAVAKVKLAAYFLQQGRESKDDPGNRYMLYMDARQLAATGGDTPLALAAVEELARSFDINLVEMKAATLAVAAAHVDSKEAGKALVDLVLPLIGEAVEADDYDSALKLGQVALDAAKKSKSLPLVTAVRKRNEEVRAVQEKFAHLKPYVDRLKTAPKDGEANYELGRYFGLMKGKWERALPLLAMGAEPRLKSLASKDLSRPAQIKDQLSLADAWWDLAQKEKDPARLNLQVRARTWYEKALLGPGRDLLAGLNRTKALKRIDQVNARLEGANITEVPVGPVGELKQFDGHTAEIKSVALSPDGRYAASGGLDETVRVWDLATGKPLSVLKGHTKQVWGVAFHPNGRQVASTSWDATARLWDIKTGQESKRFTHWLDVNGVAISRDGNLLLVGCDNKHPYLWKISSGEESKKFNGFSNYVYAVAFAPDGRHIAAGSSDKSIRIYDMTTGNQVRVIEGQTNSVHALAFSPDSRHVFSTGDGAAHQWDVASAKEVRRFGASNPEGQTGVVLGMALSADGRRLVTGGDDKIVRLWDVASGKQLQAFKGHADAINSVAISANGRFALSGGLDRTVRLWGLPAR